MLVRNVLVNGVKPYRAWGVYHGVPGSRKCIAEPLGPRSGRAVRTARRGVKSSRGGARGAGRASRRGVPARFRLRGSAFPPAPRAARPAGSRAETRRGRLPGRGHSLARSRSQGRAQGRGVRGPSEAGPRVQGQEGPGVACRTATVCRAERRLDGLESEGDPERIPRVRQETSNARDLFSAVLTCHRPPSTPLTCRPSCSAAECL